jgi:serine/threonine protein kinase
MVEERTQVQSRCPNCGAPSVGDGLCDKCRERAAGDRGGSWAPLVAPAHGGGVVLEGKYRLLEELGRGGMGTVFRALDETLDRVVAVKFLLPELQTDRLLTERFHREARAMASVRHENVLQIFSFGSYGSTPFFVMEHVEGATVERLLENATKQKALVDLARAVSILEQAAGGLAAVHRAGVVHRDVKPANIMVEAETGRVVIMDFGIGKRVQQGDARHTEATAGSPAYMAPETVSGESVSNELDHLTDIYAFGVTAFELLTSALPFDAKNWVDILVKKVVERPPRPSSRRPEIPAALDEIVHRCLATSPRDRVQSFVEVQRALGPLLPEAKRRALTPEPERLEHRRRSTSGAASRPTKPGASSPAPTQPPAFARPSTARGAGAAVRVVVADLDLSFTKMAFDLVEEAFPGNRFEAAKTNAKALDLALAAPPLLLVARLDDPDLNGLELAAALGGHPELKGVHLVLTCERITADERRVLQALGASKVVLKPVDPAEFSTILRCLAPRPTTTGPATTSRGAGPS